MGMSGRREPNKTAFSQRRPLPPKAPSKDATSVDSEAAPANPPKTMKRTRTESNVTPAAARGARVVKQENTWPKRPRWTQHMRLDVSDLPDAPTQEKYINMRVKDFGREYLRAYGWEAAQPIGRNEEKSTVEESTVEESTVEESTVEESTVEESTVEESTVEESSVEESIGRKAS